MLSKAKMTDEERGRAAYEEQAKLWPKPIGWDNLTPAGKHQWIERAKKEKRQ